MSQTGVHAIRFDRLPAVAHVQGDRLCTGCGRNLVGEPVRQDPVTQALVCQCPQCGRVEPMIQISVHAQLWLYRYASIVLAMWVTLIVAGFAGLTLLQAAVPAYALEKLTTHGGPGGSLVIHARYLHYGDEFFLLTAYLGAASLGLGLAGSITALLIFPHWPRWAVVLLVSVTPLCAGAAICVFWRHEAPHLFTWGLRFILGYMGVQLAGGLAGALVGRPLVRLLARLVLPARWRTFVAYLWVLDGKPVPGNGSTRARR